MSILEDLLSSLKEDAPVRSVLAGAHWTAVCSRHCGLASTLTGDAPHAHERVRDVGSLHYKTALELAQLARSEIALEASIGVAAMNSLMAVDEAAAVEINAADVIARYGQGKNVAVVGHFPFLEKLRPQVRSLWVIEKRPVAGEYPAEAAADLLPQADVAALTGSALVNGSLDGLLALCRPEAVVVVLGPSTPLSPVLFDYGATLISGARVVDEEAALRTIGQGAIFQQVQGARLLTLARPGFAL